MDRGQLSLDGTVPTHPIHPPAIPLQGRITKVLNMKPPEILGMIEEAAGTRMFETKKQVS